MPRVEPHIEPTGPAVRTRRTMRMSILAIIALAAAAFGFAPVREAGLRSAGHLLVANDVLAPADVIVVSLDSAGAGALEAADLVRSGVAKRVAVFADPPNEEDREFIRRGLPYEDASARQIRQLGMLGITDVLQIVGNNVGTESGSMSLAPWCDRNRFQSIVFVAARDHSRRVRRVLRRAMHGHPVRVAVRAAHFSSFDPDRWWETRDGARTAIIELQKLMLDYVVHPLSFR